MAGNNSWTNASPFLLSILRIVAAFLFLCHGADKLFNLPAGPFTLIDSAKLFTLAPGLAGILEFGGSLLLLLGLFSRPIAFILSGEMAFAYFMAHFPTNHIFPYLNGGDSAVLFCFVFLYLSAAGPGPLSMDRALRRA
ncbi:MAG TPA: DoxX family protein [Rhodanobacteraceae bacterium]|jgi:putative oxidoreductase|nr:DoxX family protein [Rhodanobacteraceae bacterium]